MNYLAEILEFYDIVQLKQLSTGQIALWYALIAINNKCSWIEWFSVTMPVLEISTGLSPSGIKNARNILKQKGLIDFKPNGTKATFYKMISLTNEHGYVNVTPNTVQDSVQDSVQNANQSSVQKTVTLNKQNKIKENNIKEKNDVIEIYNSICTNLPKVQKLTKKREKSINEFLKGFTLEEFKSICEIANNNSFLIGENDRNWKADFDFLINPNKATNILEGKYSNNTRSDYKIEGGLQLL